MNFGPCGTLNEPKQHQLIRSAMPKWRISTDASKNIWHPISRTIPVCHEFRVQHIVPFHHWHNSLSIALRLSSWHIGLPKQNPTTGAYLWDSQLSCPVVSQIKTWRQKPQRKSKTNPETSIGTNIKSLLKIVITIKSKQEDQTEVYFILIYIQIIDKFNDVINHV